jgi:surface polysaccharide O-acyltransferase-like enzyme
MKNRLVYLDNLRSFVIILVVVIHSAITYSGIGGWYYKENLQENLNVIELSFFGILESFTQAWFMGILFFIAAFLAAGSIDKRGPVAFIKERLFRLGIPLLFYVFFIAPFIYFIILEKKAITWPSLLNNYKNYISSSILLASTGPLWFAEVLLFFSIIYALIRKIYNRQSYTIKQINTKSILLVILITTVIAFLVRLAFPIGSGFYNLLFCFFPSYVVLFVLGIIVGEGKAFNVLSDEKNIKWLIISLIIGIPLWSLLMLFGGALKGEMVFYGGLYWRSFMYALWESFFAVTFSIGIIAFFRKYINIDNTITRMIAENAFGIYVFHTPFLVAVSVLLKGWIAMPIIKFIIIAIITFFSCFLFSIVIRKIKPVRIVLK